MCNCKCTLTFDMSESEGLEAAKRAMKSLDLALALFTIGEYLRKLDKYGVEEKDPNKLVSDIRDEFYSILSNYNIDLDEIIS